MTVKAKTALRAVVPAIMLTLLLCNTAHALATSQTIHLTVRVVGALSLDLEDEWISENLSEPKAEAFSELEESGILIDKYRKGDSTLWLFTKTQ